MDDEALCRCCGAQRGLLYCSQHAARLCLPCDVMVHDDDGGAWTHERAPLCNACHAAAAAVHCSEHNAALCEPCAGSAGCDAQRHHVQHPARTFTGFPEAHDLVRILFPAEPDTCCVPDLVNIELASSSSTWDLDTTMTSELPVPSADRCKGKGGDDETSVSSAAALPLPTMGGDYCDELLMQQDWPNLDDDDLDLAANNPIIAHVEEGAFEASSSLGYDDHPLLSSCSETIMPSSHDAVVQSLTCNNAACSQFSSVSTNNMPPMMPSDEFLFSTGGVSSSMGYQDHQEKSGQAGAMEEARMKQREKRQQAKQRYNDKKKKRRFGKQIMYESRKARADTRNRVKGRFAKSSSSKQNTDQI